MQPVQPTPLPQPVVSTRFGVVQKNKIRPIDNFRASHVNAAGGTSEKVLVDGPDLIAQACLKLLAQAAPSKGKDRPVGRTWDLKSAYKQLPVRADHSRFAWIAVQDTTTHLLHLAQMHSMPFGAVASVHAFLRCSEALKFLGRRHLLLVITSYFDDFTVLTWKTAAHHTTLVVEAFFQQMGWTVSPEEKKNSPFPEVFDRFDLSRQDGGIITVGNTPTRIAELTQALRDVLQSGRLSFEQAQSLRGRLLFAERHLWGRNSRQAVMTLGDVPQGHSDDARLQPAQATAIEFLLKHTLNQAPKHLSLTPRAKAFLWIDGSCEWHDHDIAPTCGLGAVLYHKDTWETLEVFFSSVFSRVADRTTCCTAASLLLAGWKL